MQQAETTAEEYRIWPVARSQRRFPGSTRFPLRNDGLADLVNQLGVRRFYQCPPVTVYPARRKSSAKSISIWAAASNGIGFKCA